MSLSNRESRDHFPAPSHCGVSADALVIAERCAMRHVQTLVSLRRRLLRLSSSAISSSSSSSSSPRLLHLAIAGASRSSSHAPIPATTASAVGPHLRHHALFRRSFILQTLPDPVRIEKLSDSESGDLFFALSFSLSLTPFFDLADEVSWIRDRRAEAGEAGGEERDREGDVERTEARARCDRWRPLCECGVDLEFGP